MIGPRPEPPFVPKIAPGTLANFLGGTLTPQEREHVLRILAESPADREVLLASVRSEHEREASYPSPLEKPHRPRGRWLPRWSMSAIGTLAAAGLVILIARRDSASELRPGTALGDQRGPGSLALVLRDSAVLHDWSIVRGGTNPAEFRLAAWQLGVLSTIAQRASAMSDEPLLRSSRNLMADLVELRPGGASQALLLRADSTGAALRSGTLLAELRSTNRNAAWFDAGVWMESVRQANIVRAMDRRAVRRTALRTLERLLDGLPRAEGDEDARLGELRTALEGMRARLARDQWSPVEDGAELERALIAGGR
jgi:hypothetical protein